MENKTEDRLDTTSEEKEKKIYKVVKNTPLTWSIIILLILCWILPLTFIEYVMLNITNGRVNAQIERTILTSANNAVKICEMQMNTAVMASRDASYLPTIRESYRQYRVDQNKTAFYGKITRFLEQHYRYDENFLNTFLIFTDEPDEPYYISRVGTTNDSDYKNSLRSMKEVQPLVMEIFQELDTDIKYINVDDHMYMVRNIMDSNYHPYAVIVMELDVESIFESLKSTWGYASGAIYVDGELLISSGTDQNTFISDDKKLPEEILKENNRNAELLLKDGEYYVYSVRKPDRHSIGYVIVLDKQAVIGGTETTKFVFTLALFMVPLIIIIFLFFHRKVTAPINRLIKASRIIEEGQFGYQIKTPGNSQEFEYLTEAFNSMSAKLKHQFETIYSEELALKDARIMALQSQINPHFLNNTLEIINWEARINENYKVSHMIENLSIMLEATMDRRHRRFVTVAEEMSYVEAYLFIIAQRLGERLHVRKHVDETLFNVKVPRLIIQPIIENAAEHGITGQTHGIITINVFAREDKLIIEVRNTGTMSAKDEEKIRQLLGDDYEPGEIGSTSLGIRNVNRRIKIIYGDDCGLTVQNAEHNETVSTIVVKLDYDNNKRQ